MKILYLVNLMIPKISYAIGEQPNSLGGWIESLISPLQKEEDIEICMIFPHNKELSGFAENIKYYSFKDTHNFERIITDEKPEIIHIFGTEFKHTLDMVNACEKLNYLDKVVVNIQGLTTLCAKHFTSGIPAEYLGKKGISDLIYGNDILKQVKAFEQRSLFELEVLKKVKNVIGRTDWDKAFSKQVNPMVQYNFCNETLRDEFYYHDWDINSCEKNSIFLSQASYPIKGFHFVLQALPEVIKRFPNTKVYIAGHSPLMGKGKFGYLMETAYSRYLHNLINENDLDKHIVFLGNLDEKEMCQRFLKSNVFVSASTVENESNSVSEAKILGVPVVASYVGGVTNRIINKQDGFSYQHDSPYMLAFYINEIFANNDLANLISRNAKKNANIVHDKVQNKNQIISIYNKMLSK